MKIFIASADQDREVCNNLLQHLNLLKDRKGWSIWPAQKIRPEDHWGVEAKQQLFNADIVILLLSSYFFNSKNIVETELLEVIDKHKMGKCQVIPVIVRACHWKETSLGEHLKTDNIQIFPFGERPIMSKSFWDHEDQPYFEAVAGIKDTIQAFQEKKKEDLLTAELEALTLQKQEQENNIKEKVVIASLETEYVHRTVDQTAWHLATNTNSIVGYQTYLNQHPQGGFAIESQIKIKELTEKAGAAKRYRRYASICMVVLAVLFFAIWVTPKIFNTDKEALEAESSSNTSSSENSDNPNKIESGFEMVAVEGGTFIMGSPENKEAIIFDECQHSVTINPFNIGKYEVTQADWRSVMGSNPPENEFDGCDQCPVDQVSWDDIQDFLRKINSKYPGKNYRLPTEAEWEYAARGGNESRGYTYSGSNDPLTVAWHPNNSDNKTHPIGQKKPNELGLYDMSGNVWEWCQDLYFAYTSNCKLNGSFNEGYVLRGGGYWHGQISGYTSTTNRGHSEPTNRGPGSFGFRLVTAKQISISPNSGLQKNSNFIFDYPLVKVEGGTFQMGSNDHTFNSKLCTHPVTLSAFSIGKYEVTQSQWMSVMGNNPSQHKNCDECPVENVSWDNIQSFINKLNEKTGGNYSLPTEAEWEYAARGGNKSRGYEYAGSNDLNSIAWYKSPSYPVGQKKSNELGLYDMSGNVMEWCQDSYKSYPCESVGFRYATRIVRGGGGKIWDPFFCLVYFRAAQPPFYFWDSLGFRLTQK